MWRTINDPLMKAECCSAANLVTHYNEAPKNRNKKKHLSIKYGTLSDPLYNIKRWITWTVWDGIRTYLNDDPSIPCLPLAQELGETETPTECGFRITERRSKPH